MASIENLQTDLIWTKNTETRNQYQFYLDDEIKEPFYYRKLFETCQNATNQDEIEVIISTVGGYVHTAIQIIDHLKNTEASTKAIIYMASSTGGLIAFACQKIEPKPFSELMIHPIQNWQGYDAAPNHVRSAKVTEERSRRLITETFKDFLTKEELSQVNDSGIDLEFSDLEMRKRLKKMGRLV